MIDLTLGFSPIRSQGNNLGSCGAFAACSVFEYIINRAHGLYGGNRVQLSPLYNYFFNRSARDYATTRAQYNTNPIAYGRNRQPGCFAHNNLRDIPSGQTIPEIKSAVEQFGICTEREWTYENGTLGNVQGGYGPHGGYEGHFEGKFSIRPSQPMITNGYNLLTRYISKIDVTGHEPDRWIQELRAGFPILVGIKVSNEFRHPKGRVLESALGLSGGHGIVIVGYDKVFRPDPINRPNHTIEAFKIRNSWGESWGNRGYVWIKRSTLSSMIYTHALIFRPKHRFSPMPGPTPRPTPPPTPTPTPTPTPAPTGRGRFTKAWYLFDNDAQYDEAVRHNWSPDELARRGIGVRLTSNVGVRQNRAFFDDASQLPHGKVLGLGACRNDNTNYWRWDKYVIGGPPPPPPGQIKLHVNPPENDGTEVRRGENLDIGGYFEGTQERLDLTFGIYKPNGEIVMPLAGTNNTPPNHRVEGDAVINLDKGEYYIYLFARDGSNNQITPPRNFNDHGDFNKAEPDRRKIEVVEDNEIKLKITRPAKSTAQAPGRIRIRQGETKPVAGKWTDDIEKLDLLFGMYEQAGNDWVLLTNMPAPKYPDVGKDSEQGDNWTFNLNPRTYRIYLFGCLPSDRGVNVPGRISATPDKLKVGEPVYLDVEISDGPVPPPSNIRIIVEPTYEKRVDVDSDPRGYRYVRIPSDIDDELNITFSVQTDRAANGKFFRYEVLFMQDRNGKWFGMTPEALERLNWVDTFGNLKRGQRLNEYEFEMVDSHRGSVVQSVFREGYRRNVIHAGKEGKNVTIKVKPMLGVPAKVLVGLRVGLLGAQNTAGYAGQDSYGGRPRISRNFFAYYIIDFTHLIEPLDPKIDKNLAEIEKEVGPETPLSWTPSNKVRALIEACRKINDKIQELRENHKDMLKHYKDNPDFNRTYNLCQRIMEALINVRKNKDNAILDKLLPGLKIKDVKADLKLLEQYIQMYLNLINNFQKPGKYQMQKRLETNAQANAIRDGEKMQHDSKGPLPALPQDVQHSFADVSPITSEAIYPDKSATTKEKDEYNERVKGEFGNTDMLKKANRKGMW